MYEMNKWVGATKASFKRWKNAGKWGEQDIVGHADEDQTTDYEICTVTAPRVDSDSFTVDDAMEAFGFGKFQVKMYFFAGLSWTADVMEIMLLSILGPQLHCEWRLSNSHVALITMVVFIGMIIGSPIWGYISDNFGRRVGMVMSSCWIFYFSMLTTFSPVYIWIVLLRGIVGFGMGGVHQSMGLLTEFLPLKSRGISLVLIGLFWAGGCVLEVLLAMLVMPTLGWRWLVALSSVPSGIFLCFCCWMPESPRFCVVKGRRDSAIAVLRRIAKDNGKTLPTGKLVVHQQSAHGQFKDLFTPQYRKITVLLWLIGFTYNFCYYGVILMTTDLFKARDSCGESQGTNNESQCSLECKYLTSADYESLLWTTFAEIPGILSGIVLIDCIGRKKTMALSFFMFALCIMPLMACIGRTAITILLFIARALLIGGFQTYFVYKSEAYPTENRSFAMGTANALGKLGGLITPFIAQVLIRTSLHLTLAVYCGSSLLGAIACLLLPIETSGKRLQDTKLS